jgi:hypothetical protein
LKQKSSCATSLLSATRRLLLEKKEKMIDTQSLYTLHAYDTPFIDDWIDCNGGDIDAIRAFGPIAEMLGQFARRNNPQIYDHTFTPDQNGQHCAVVMPITEDGKMVDIVAFVKMPFARS